MPLVTINDENYLEHVASPVLGDGDRRARGLVPRDFNKYPVGCYAWAKPFDLPLIPESEWESRLAIQKANKASLKDIRDTALNGQPIPSRDQNGKGYCWAHSGTSATLLVRAVMGLPYADLSAYAVACIIKNFRDQGGWGAEGLEFIAERGVPDSSKWPQQSMSRTNDNPATWENAKRNRVTEWMDLAESGSQVKQQLVTCLLCGIPVVVDYNWWSHSVCAMAIESLSPFKIWIWNSWGDSWSENGAGLLEGNKAIPNGAIAPRVVTPASNVAFWLAETKPEFSVAV